MTLIVEDGTVVAGANCYCSLTFANAWHSSRGMTLWATDMTDPEREAAIIRAAQFMQQSFRMRWLGYRKTTTQSMDWPRYEVERKDGPMVYGYAANWYDDDVVPIEVQQANAELAYKAAFGDLLEDYGRLTKREKVDAIEVEYFIGSSPTIKYISVERLLSPLLRDGGGVNVSVERV